MKRTLSVIGTVVGFTTFGAGLATLAGCGKTQTCLDSASNTGEVLSEETKSDRTCGRGGCRDVVWQVLRIKRDEDGTVCAGVYSNATGYRVGDKVRGPL